MKKKTLIILTLVLAAVLAGALLIALRERTVDAGSFEVREYRQMIERFPSGENVGGVLHAKDAAKKAEALWTELFGRSVIKEKPYRVSYDEAAGVWLVEGTLRQNLWHTRKGGTAKILIEGDTGNVIAAWHEE